ncbi:MAG: zinc ribbon domain-containing protein [Chloroflexi bacterium]|nr:MAG: zinc ribbon domain-containing protein [Chloroflexota bacterium]
MICEHCGKEISANAAICPSCGTVVQPPTSYGRYSSREYDNPQPMPTYEQGYTPLQNSEPVEAVSYPPPPKQEFGYGPAYYAQTAYQPQPGSINVTVVNTFTTSSSNYNRGALLAEIFLSLFGIYGVGWLIAGETTIGVVLLICSFALFWPLAIMIAIFTLGFGIIFCNLPLAIGGIVLNAILLNNALNRKAKLVSYTTVQSQQQMPPRQARPQ